MNALADTIVYKPEAEPEKRDSKMPYTLTVYAENRVGILTKVSNIFSKRKINIEELTTSPCEIDGIHRFNILIYEHPQVVAKLVRQIEKLVDVLKVYYNTEDEIIYQELALYKLSTEEITEKVMVERLLRKLAAQVVCVRKDYTVFAVTGHREETDAMVEALQPFGLIEFVRSARIAIIKNSKGFHEKLKEFEAEEPSEVLVENEFLNDGDKIFSM